MKIGKINNRTLHKLLTLISLTFDKRAILTVDEIMSALDCCKGTAYQYQRALRYLFPKGQFRTRNQQSVHQPEGGQQCLT
jgi:hypothetical protein